MTLYAGETVRIKATGSDLDGVALTSANITSSTVGIYDATAALVISGAMTWDGTHHYWFYDWSTSDSDIGNFRAKVTFNGATFDTWEIVKVSLKQSPV